MSQMTLKNTWDITLTKTNLLIIFQEDPTSSIFLILLTKVKVGVLRPVQQPDSNWYRFSALPLLGLKPIVVTPCD